MDPAQRKLLEVTYEAFENAGETWDSVSGSRTGVFVGNFNHDHQLMQMRECDYPLPYAATGGDVTMLSNRINYVFNLRGPRYVYYCHFSSLCGIFALALSLSFCKFEGLA